MNHRRISAIGLNYLMAFVGLLTLHGLAGCGNGAGEALPSATDVVIKHDAAPKRDTASATVTGGAGGGTIALGTGGSGGATDIGGTGGSTAIVPDAAPPRDVAPDLPATGVPDTRPVPDVGGTGIEVSTAVDTASEGSQDLVKQDVGPPDVPSEGPRDTRVDAQDSASDVASDLVSDVVADLSELGADLLVTPDIGPDATSVDAAPDTQGPTCSNPGWAKQFTLSQGSLSGDKDGNLFVANTLYDSVILGGAAGTMTTVGDGDALLMRMGPTTGSAAWAKQFGDGALQTGTGVAVDKSGHVGFIGGYQGSMTIGTSAISNSQAWPDGYIGAVQATDGAGLWAKSVALMDATTQISTQPSLAAIAANPNVDHFVVCGSASVAATDLNPPSPLPALAAGGTDDYDIVVAKIKGSDGSVVWARQIGGAGNQMCMAAAVDDNGNVLIAGNYSGQLDFGSGAFSPVAATNVTLPWVAKLAGADGSTLAVTHGQPGTTGGMASFVSALDTDSAGNVAIAGFFRKAITFGTLTVTSASTSSYDALAVKFSSSLEPIWAKNWGDSDTQSAMGIAFDSGGNLSVVGRFNKTINIGSGGAILTAASSVDPTSGLNTNNSDLFFARIDGATGNPQCALRFGDYGSQEADGVFIARSATGAAKDTTVVVGSLTSVLDFGSVSLSTSGPGIENFWVAKF